MDELAGNYRYCKDQQLANPQKVNVIYSDTESYSLIFNRTDHVDMACKPGYSLFWDAAGTELFEGFGDTAGEYMLYALEIK